MGTKIRNPSYQIRRGENRDFGRYYKKKKIILLSFTLLMTPQCIISVQVYNVYRYMYTSRIGIYIICVYYTTGQVWVRIFLLDYHTINLIRTF